MLYRKVYPEVEETGSDISDGKLRLRDPTVGHGFSEDMSLSRMFQVVHALKNSLRTTKVYLFPSIPIGL